MTTSMIQIVRCPNCGSLANRSYFNDNNTSVVRTDCDVCDYVLEMSFVNGGVRVEYYYAPGIDPQCLKQLNPTVNLKLSVKR